MTQGPARTEVSKKSLRESVLRARRSLDAKEVEKLSGRVHRNLSSLIEYASARVLECYVAMKDEVQTEGIILSSLGRGVRVLVPMVNSSRTKLLFSELHDFSELAESHFGIMEPKSEFQRPANLDDAEVIIVPLVAWDDRGFRIGQGKGYFDRALASLGRSIPTVGLAFELQRVQRVPTEPHDIPLKFVVTESRVIRFEGH